VTVTLYDGLGRELVTLFSGQAEGLRAYAIDGARNHTRGAAFLHLRSEKGSKTLRIVRGL
jgi:hypothetical protein